MATTMRTPIAALVACVTFLAAVGLSSAAQAASAVAQVTHLSGTLIARRADGSTKLLSVRS